MKYCEKCGAQLLEGSAACPACGAPVMAAQPVTPTPVQEPAVQAPVAPAPLEQPAVQAAVAPAPAPVQPAPVAPAPVAPMQPVYTQPVAPAPVAPKKKGAGVPVVLVIILLVVMAASGVLVGKVLFGGNSDRCAGGTVNNSSTNSIEEPEKDEEPVQLATNTEAYLSGHKFTIPSTYNFEVDDDDVLWVYDDSQEWIAEMAVTQYLYDTISTNIENIINNFKTSGYTVEGYQEKTIEGVTLIEIKIIDTSGRKILAAYAKVSDAYIGVITVYNQTGSEYETTRFNEAVKILSTAQRTTTSRDTATTKTSGQLVSFLPQS